MVNKIEFEKIFAEQAIRFWKTSYSKLIYNYLKLMRKHTGDTFKPTEYDAIRQLVFASGNTPGKSVDLTDVVQAPFFRAGIAQLVDYIYDADYSKSDELDPKTLSQNELKHIWNLILNNKTELLASTEQFQERLANNFDEMLKLFYDFQQLEYFERLPPGFYESVADYYASNNTQSATTETYCTLKGIYMNCVGALETRFSEFIKPNNPGASAFNKFDDYLHYYESISKILDLFYDADNPASEEPSSDLGTLPSQRGLFTCMRQEIANAIKYPQYTFIAEDKTNFVTARLSHKEFDELCAEANLTNTNLQWLFLVFSYRNCLTGTLCKQSYKGDDLREFQDSTKAALEAADVFLKYCLPV